MSNRLTLRVYIKAEGIQRVSQERISTVLRKNTVLITVKWPGSSKEIFRVGPLYGEAEPNQCLIHRMGERVLLSIGKKNRGKWGQVTEDSDEMLFFDYKCELEGRESQTPSKVAQSKMSVRDKGLDTSFGQDQTDQDDFTSVNSDRSRSRHASEISPSRDYETHLNFKNRNRKGGQQPLTGRDERRTPKMRNSRSQIEFQTAGKPSRRGKSKRGKAKKSTYNQGRQTQARGKAVKGKRGNQSKIQSGSREELISFLKEDFNLEDLEDLPYDPSQFEDTPLSSNKLPSMEISETPKRNNRPATAKGSKRNQERQQQVVRSGNMPILSMFNRKGKLQSTRNGAPITSKPAFKASQNRQRKRGLSKNSSVTRSMSQLRSTSNNMTGRTGGNPPSQKRSKKSKNAGLRPAVEEPEFYQSISKNSFRESKDNLSRGRSTVSRRQNKNRNRNKSINKKSAKIKDRNSKKLKFKKPNRKSQSISGRRDISTVKKGRQNKPSRKRSKTPEMGGRRSGRRSNLDKKKEEEDNFFFDYHFDQDYENDMDMLKHHVKVEDILYGEPARSTVSNELRTSQRDFFTKPHISRENSPSPSVSTSSRKPLVYQKHQKDLVISRRKLSSLQGNGARSKTPSNHSDLKLNFNNKVRPKKSKKWVTTTRPRSRSRNISIRGNGQTAQGQKLTYKQVKKQLQNRRDRSRTPSSVRRPQKEVNYQNHRIIKVEAGTPTTQSKSKKTRRPIPYQQSRKYTPSSLYSSTSSRSKTKNGAKAPATPKVSTPL